MDENSALDPQDWQDVLSNEETDDNEGLMDYEEDEDYEEDDEDESWEDDEDEYEDEDEEFEEEDEDEEEDLEEDDEDLEDFQEEEEVPQKRVQSKEENARFAEQRRQQQIQAKLQESPEYKLAQTLAMMNNVSVEEMLQRVQQAEIEKQAQEQGVPVHVMKRMQEQENQAKQLQEQIQSLEFERWYDQRQAEASSILEKYNGIISQDDVDEALSFMLTELGTTSITLDKAVRLLHGDKLEAELKRIAKQEALAEYSGRKSAPLPTNGVKTTSRSALTAEERYFAQQLGINEKAWSAYK